MRVDFTVQCRIRWGSSEPRASSVCHEWWRRLAPLSPCTGARYLVIYLTRCRGDEDFVFIFLAVEGWTSHLSAVDLFVFNFLTLFRCSLSCASSLMVMFLCFLQRGIVLGVHTGKDQDKYELTSFAKRYDESIGGKLSESLKMWVSVQAFT